MGGGRVGVGWVGMEVVGWVWWVGWWWSGRGVVGGVIRLSF